MISLKLPYRFNSTLYNYSDTCSVHYYEPAINFGGIMYYIFNVKS